MDNEFIIKINRDSQGNQLSLSNITIEAADALKIFIESLSDFAKLQSQQSDLRLSLKDGCIESCLAYPSLGTDIESEIDDVIEGKSHSNDNIKILKIIQDKIKLNGLDYTVIHKKGNTSIDLTAKFKAKNFALKRAQRREFDEKVEFIEGRLFETGGKVRTNIHLESFGEEYKVECTQQQAIELNRRLYSEVYLAVLKRNKKDQKPVYSLLDSYLNPHIYFEFKELYLSAENEKSLVRYDIVHNWIVKAIEAEDSKSGNILKLLRLYNYSQSDRGMLRTILMTLKPVSTLNGSLLVMYKSLADILRSGSTNNRI